MWLLSADLDGFFFAFFTGVVLMGASDFFTSAANVTFKEDVTPAFDILDSLVNCLGGTNF